MLLETKMKDVLLKSLKASLKAFKLAHRIPNENHEVKLAGD